MSAAGLSGKLGSSQSTILHAIDRMAAAQIVEKCAESYRLTGAGLVQDSILQQTANGLAVLESNIDFWAQHDISEIPSHLMARLSDLEGGHVISGDSIFQAQQIFINQLAAAKKIYGVSPIIFPGYVESTLAACQNGAEVHLIVTSPILEIMRTKTATAFEALQKIESFHLYEIDTAKVAFAIIDDVLSFGLYRLDGEYDATTDLGCPGERARAWGLDLFHHYLKKATAI